MRVSLYILLLFVISFAGSCKKSSQNKSGCFPDDQATEHINNKKLIVSGHDGTFSMSEAGTIDDVYTPCNLPEDFQVSGLHVTIDGYSKPAGGNVCCIHNLVITKISR